MNKQIITIAGGGSTYTPGIVTAILKHKKFPIKEIRLYDNNELRNANMEIIIKYILRINKLDKEIVLLRTENPEEAFKGTDFIFSQIRVGLMQMREKDEKIPLSYGLVGQETCGLGGFAFGLRSIKGMLEIAGYVNKYAPDAWILNYTNPEAIIAEAINREYPDLKIINACDQTISILNTIAENYGYDNSTWNADYYGLNHFGWFTSIYDRETKKELMPEILDRLRSENLEALSGEDDSWNQAFNMISHIVRKFPDYIPNNYLQYYLYPDLYVKNANKNYTRANEVMDGREKNINDLVELIKNNNVSDEDNDKLKVGIHGEYIVNIASSILYNEPNRFILIIKNNGIISNFREDAMVEVPVIVDKNGPRAVSENVVIPNFHKALMENQNAAEKTLVDAYFEKSYNKALEAFTLNRTCPSADLAEKVLNDFIEVNKEFWPELK